MRNCFFSRHPPPAAICPTGTRPSNSLPVAAKQELRQWLERNEEHPYPDLNDRLVLVEKTGEL